MTEKTYAFGKLKDLLPGDLVCYKTAKTPYPVTRVDDRGMIRFDWIGVDAAEIPENISRPKLKVGMWVRLNQVDITRHTQYRIETIDYKKLTFDAHVSKSLEQEGEILIQPSGWGGSLSTWLPVADPVEPEPQPEPKKREETMSENYRVGDLVRVVFRSDALFVVTDAGIGKPRSQIHLKAVVGKKVIYDVNEANLRRPKIKKGDWVRHVDGNPDRKHIAEKDSGQFRFDLLEEMDESFASTSSGVALQFWIPVEAPKNFKPEEFSKEVHSKVEDLEKTAWDARNEANLLAGENDRLKNQVASLSAQSAQWVRSTVPFTDHIAVLVTENKSLTEQIEKLKNKRDATIYDCNRTIKLAADQSGKTNSDLEFVRSLLVDTRNARDNAYIAHSDAIAERDQERYKKEKARDQIHRLESEILALRRQSGPTKTRIVM